MINRFSEMVMQGVAKPRYEDKFSNDSLNAEYRSLDNITREYNSVWGALTGTLMRKANDGIYYITGTEITKVWFKRLMYAERFDTTFFANCFPGRNICCLNSFFQSYNLTTEMTILNGSPAIKVWEGLDYNTSVLNTFANELGCDFAYCGGYYSCPDCELGTFEALLDKEFNGLKCYANESKLKEIGAKTLRESINKLDLIIANSENKVILYKKEKLEEKVNELIAQFKDDSVLVTENETIFSNNLFEKYRVYLSENQSVILPYVQYLIENQSDKLGKVLFPFTESRKQDVLSMMCRFAIVTEGVGSIIPCKSRNFSDTETVQAGISYQFINGDTGYITFNENFIANLADKLSFFIAE